MKVRELLIQALREGTLESELLMSDLTPVQRVYARDINGHVVSLLSDEEPEPEPAKPTATVHLKFNLYGFDPNKFIEWINDEVDSVNATQANPPAIGVGYASATFDPLTDSEDDVACYAARQLLVNSLADIDYDYNHLTAGEKKDVTRAQFEALLRQFKMGK